jgi:GWxTD domain-containing protein
MNVVWVFVLLLFSSAGVPFQYSNSKNIKTEDDYYRKWLDQDVAYIIDPEEREVYKSLKTNEEREKFIEQFWQRRNPDPDNTNNSFKEEHYRRIAYANDHFSTGMPGWKSDRGRIYILHGKPDSIESHGAGETYYRPRSEGLGVTTTFAWELWNYRHIDGVGDNVNVEFVDKSMSGHYELAVDEMDKDMLLMVPGLGYTESDLRNFGNKAERIGVRYMASENAQRMADPMRSISADTFSFERIRRMARLQHAPEIKYKDLESIVSTQVHYTQLPFEVRVDMIKATENDYLVPLTFYFDRSRVGYRRAGPILGAKVNVYGRIETLTKTTVYAFDDDVNAYFNEEEMRSVSKRSIYQRNVPLKPGRYKLTAVVKDSVTGKLGTLERGILVPGNDQKNGVNMSEIILADRIYPSQQGEFITDPFVLGTVKVYPNAANQFVKGQPLGFYFEIYNASVDAQSGDPALKVTLRLVRDGKEIETPFRDLERRLHSYGDRYFMGALMSTEPLEPGNYKLTMTVSDKISTGRASKTASFTVLPPSQEPQ